MVHPTPEGVWLGGVSPWPVDEGEVKSGQERDQCAFQQLKFWEAWKYLRFLWSFRISIMCLPSKM